MIMRDYSVLRSRVAFEFSSFDNLFISPPFESFRNAISFRFQNYSAEKWRRGFVRSRRFEAQEAWKVSDAGGSQTFQM